MRVPFYLHIVRISQHYMILVLSGLRPASIYPKKKIYCLHIKCLIHARSQSLDKHIKLTLMIFVVENT